MSRSEALKDQKVLVTGGTSGIGQAIAIAAAEAGADVAYCGLSDEGSHVTRDGIERAGRRAYFEALDLSDLSNARSFARNAIKTLGGLDALINNAGRNFKRGVLSASQCDIAQCLATNFYPAWALSQEAYPVLKAAGGGTIINITSVHACRTVEGHFPYNVSKAALSALTRSLAIEWGRDNIRTIEIAPGLIFSAMNQDLLEPDPGAMVLRAALEAHHPLGRGGRPEEIAALVVALLGPAGSFVSGTTISADGGIGALLESPISRNTSNGSEAGPSFSYLLRRVMSAIKTP